jgi:hypothetical protein
MPDNQPLMFVVDSDHLTPENSAALKYALIVREHISARREMVMRGLNTDQLTPEEAAVGAALLDSLDATVMRDIATIADIEIPEGYQVNETVTTVKEAGE